MNKISIITVTYNNGIGLEKTIKSVIVQKKLLADLEYIIIDGASTDNTCEIAKQYNEYIDVFISEKDSGIFNAMNKGFKIATGCSILFLNAGDYFYKDFNLKIFQEKYPLDEKTVFTYTIQTFEDMSFIRPSRRKQILAYADFGHQGVFATIEDCKDNHYDERFRISADNIWQEKIWKKNNYIIAEEISSIFSIGGISSNFDYKNLQILYE